MGDWTLFSNHGHVLVCLARNKQARLRDVANDVGITERAVQKIVRELQLADLISISKQGRCNRYSINTRKNLRHDLESSCTVGRLLALFAVTGSGKADPAQAAKTGTQTAPVALSPAGGSADERKAPADEKAVAQRKSTPPKKDQAGKEEPPESRQQGSLF